MPRGGGDVEGIDAVAVGADEQCAVLRRGDAHDVQALRLGYQIEAVALAVVAVDTFSTGHEDAPAGIHADVLQRSSHVLIIEIEVGVVALAGCYARAGGDHPEHAVLVLSHCRYQVHVAGYRPLVGAGVVAHHAHHAPARSSSPDAAVAPLDETGDVVARQRVAGFSHVGNVTQAVFAVGGLHALIGADVEGAVGGLQEAVHVVALQRGAALLVAEGAALVAVVGAEALVGGYPDATVAVLVDLIHHTTGQHVVRRQELARLSPDHGTAQYPYKGYENVSQLHTLFVFGLQRYEKSRAMQKEKPHFFSLPRNFGRGLFAHLAQSHPENTTIAIGM